MSVVLPGKPAAATSGNVRTFSNHRYRHKGLFIQTEIVTGRLSWSSSIALGEHAVLVVCRMRWVSSRELHQWTIQTHQFYFCCFDRKYNNRQHAIGAFFVTTKIMRTMGSLQTIRDCSSTQSDSMDPTLSPDNISGFTSFIHSHSHERHISILGESERE